MSESQTQSISRDKFLIMAANLLHKVLLDIPRTEAKTLYKNISKGDVVHLATVKMEDQSTVRFRATLDHSEFKGKLNFGAFRSSLALLATYQQEFMDQFLCTFHEWYGAGAFGSVLLPD